MAGLAGTVEAAVEVATLWKKRGKRKVSVLRKAEDGSKGSTR